MSMIVGQSYLAALAMANAIDEDDERMEGWLSELTPSELESAAAAAVRMADFAQRLAQAKRDQVGDPWAVQ